MRHLVLTALCAVALSAAAASPASAQSASVAQCQEWVLTLRALANSGVASDASCIQLTSYRFARQEIQAHGRQCSRQQRDAFRHLIGRLDRQVTRARNRCG